MTLFNATTTNLNGAGVRVAQAEAEIDSSSPPTFEVNPAAVGLVNGNISYFVGPPIYVLPQSSSTYPTTFGAESWHADDVGLFFYSSPGGISPGVAHVDNYEGEYFFVTVVPGLMAINDPIVNQSFVASSFTNVEQQLFDSDYDNYAAFYRTLFVSGAGDGGMVSTPATCYNGIAVAAYGGASSIGPTPDNGRAKPDLTAPGDTTSFTTPLVSGAAALLLQAGVRGDGGADTNSAADPRTLKALLMNGAVKPSDWTNPAPSPLDTRYGTGILNVFNSYRQLTAGKQGFIESGTVSSGGAHPPLNNTNNLPQLSGWDFNTNSSSALSDGINHYYLNLPDGADRGRFVATVSLVWNRQYGQSNINHLDLFLYNTATGGAIAASTSSVDNIQHIYLPQLPPGRYDLQVRMRGGLAVSSSETYALAFEFFQLHVAVRNLGANIQVSWPLYPAGFNLENTGSLTLPANWNRDYTPAISNNQNVVTIPASTGYQSFRLARP